MSKRTGTRKRPYRAHEFGRRLGEELANLGDGGYIKVVMPDGLSAHRIVGLTSTLEEDLLVRLEEAPCWRKRSESRVETEPPADVALIEAAVAAAARADILEELLNVYDMELGTDNTTYKVGEAWLAELREEQAHEGSEANLRRMRRIGL